MTRLAILLLRPYEKAWAWHIRRQYRKGRFQRPYGDPRDIGKPCVKASHRDAA